jgi:disease resistance protein RPM1
MYTQVNKLVGINKSSSELMSMLQSSPQQDDVSNTKMKTVSVVGPGGLGKTTLVKAVYDRLIADYDCSAFVSVGRTPDMKKVIQAILIKLNKERYMHFNFVLLHEISQFIDELREFLLQHKRYTSTLSFEVSFQFVVPSSSV